MRGKIILLVLTAIVVISAVTKSYCETQGSDPVFMFWNLENFFDTDDGGGGDSDKAFSLEGERRWTKSRFWKKVHGVAKTIMWAGDEFGSIPAVIGFAEVENAYVVNMVTKATNLRKYGYNTVHFDSPDPRGIDVALIYRPAVFEKISARACALTSDEEGNQLTTRDILLVKLRNNYSGDNWYFLVNHHPSKYGGTIASAPKRRAAMRLLSRICDSLKQAGEHNIVAMGDFNDCPEAEVFGIIESGMHNHGRELSERGVGTIKYQGRWELIDMFITDSTLLGCSRMEVCRPGFLLSPDGQHSGYKPLRTYVGPRYAGGLSDHLPIVLKLKY